MFEIVTNADRATSLQPLFAGELQAVYDDFAEFAGNHGLVYEYTVYNRIPLPKGDISIIAYRIEYDRILGRLDKNQETIDAITAKERDLQDKVDKLSSIISEQNDLIADHTKWLESSSDVYSQVAMFNDDSQLQQIESEIEDRQSLIKRAELKKAGTEKALKQIDGIKSILSAIKRWIESQIKVDEFNAAQETFDAQLKKFAEEFKALQAKAKKVNVYGSDDYTLTMRVVKALGMERVLK